MRPNPPKRLDRLAWWLDQAIRIPGTNFRIGLDGLIGLIPGFGDAASGVISSYIIAEAARLGAPKSTLIRMGFNVVIDTLIGMIPLAGDLFDFVWKANTRNMRLLDEHLENPRKTTSESQGFVIGVGIVIIAFVIGAIWLGIIVLNWLIQAAGSA